MADAVCITGIAVGTSDDSFIKEKNHLSIAISLKETSRASVFAAANPSALFRASKMALDLST